MPMLPFPVGEMALYPPSKVHGVFPEGRSRIRVNAGWKAVDAETPDAQCGRRSQFYD